MNVTLVDGLALYSIGETAMPYTRLHEILNNIRQDNGYLTADNSTLFISSNNSHGQKRFISAIEKTNFCPESINFKDLYVSGTEVQSFASRISFCLGRLTRHESPNILVVSNSFEIKFALLDILSLCPSAKVGIAYFTKHLDKRWKDLGGHFFKKDSGIDFFPLDEYSEELLGVNLRYDYESNHQVNRPSMSY